MVLRVSAAQHKGKTTNQRTTPMVQTESMDEKSFREDAAPHTHLPDRHLYANLSLPAESRQTRETFQMP